MRARSVTAVPAPVAALLAVALVAQIAWHASRPGVAATAADLPEPPPVRALRVAALGDEIVLAKLLMLWLQAYDNQPGISIPFSRLDYGRVERWLGCILALDPRAQYPLLAASRVYTQVPDESRLRTMLDFVYRAFPADPARRWRWLAHAAILARHRLKDLPLALRYARAITDAAARVPGIPAWARDMSVLLLADLGEAEAARVLIGGLLDSGTVTDPHEVRFLLEKLEQLEAGSRQRAP